MSHHPDNRLVVHPGNAGVELHAHGVHGRIDVNVKSAVGHQEVLPGKFLQREGCAAVEGVVLGEDRIHFFIVQGRPVAEAVVLPAGKNHVGLAAFQQLVGFQGVIHHPEIHADIRTDALVAVEQLRHPVHGDAGVGRNADDLFFLLGNGVDLVFQVGIGLQKLPDGGHELPPLRTELDAVVVALQQGKAHLPFQGIHHVGQSRLGVAHHLRRFGEAAKVNRRHKNFQFLAVHTSPLHFISITFSNTHIINMDFSECKGNVRISSNRRRQKK